ncbi:MAG: hydrogenase maturation nickel metallochaperone HypA [Candidatus Dormibacteria bacterium]
MHELSLAQAILDTVHKHSDARKVTRVTVRIGYFRQVVPDSLRFSWEVLIQDSEIDGCELEIEQVPAVVRCPACHKESTLDLPLVMCPDCNSPDVELVSGEEFQIASIDVAEEVH